MTGTNCDQFTYNQSRSYLNHLIQKNVKLCWLYRIYGNQRISPEKYLDNGGSHMCVRARACVRASEVVGFRRG
jgi:hypothetical protein